MTQKEKELLLKDLSARLPYGVIGQCEIDASYDTSFDTIFQSHKFDAVVYGLKEDLLLVNPLIEDNDEQEFATEEVADGVDILNFKSYLRPMSSMTEEEKEELKSKCIHTETEEDWEGVRCDIWGIQILEKYDTRRWDNIIWSSTINMDAIDWLNSRHFDYRGLIERGLAIEVTEENNPYKDLNYEPRR